MTRTVVIGVGNPYRRDDAAGLEVAARVRAAAPSGVEVLTHDGEPASLMDLWQDADVAYVIDAVPPNGTPGSVYQIHVGSEPVPDHPRRDSSHTIGLGDTVELARALGRLPGRLVLIGIEGADFSAGEGLSASVLASARIAAGSVLGEIEEVGG
jgi:hydrogenase maturation protease